MEKTRTCSACKGQGREYLAPCCPKKMFIRCSCAQRNDDIAIDLVPLWLYAATLEEMDNKAIKPLSKTDD